MEKLMTPAQVAEFLGVKLGTLYAWTHRRQIPFQKVGRALRFSPKVLDEWLMSQASVELLKDRGDGDD